MKPIIPNTLCLYISRSSTYEIISQNEQIFLMLSKASKWEMMIFVKRICIHQWGISLTHQINCSESFEGQKWSIERNYPSLNEAGPVNVISRCPEKAKNTCKSNWNSEQNLTFHIARNRNETYKMIMNDEISSYNRYEQLNKIDANTQ